MFPPEIANREAWSIVRLKGEQKREESNVDYYSLALPFFSRFLSVFHRDAVDFHSAAMRYAWRRCNSPGGCGRTYQN